MICPHCKGTLLYPARAWHNAMTYDRSVRVTTECCSKPVTLAPVKSISISPVFGNAGEDDWGVPYLKTKVEADAE
jgi:hypothetical protein